MTECLSNGCVMAADEAPSATMPAGAPVLELVARARTEEYAEVKAPRYGVHGNSVIGSIC